MTFLLAGVLLGAAFLDAHAQPLAWVGLVVLTVAFQRARSTREALVGGFAALLTKQGLGLFWMLPTQARFLELTGPQALGLCALMHASMTGLLFIPVAVGVLSRRWLPVRWWLPGAWASGEALLEWVSGAGMGHLLHSQWAVRPVLHGLAYLGWFPVLLLVLYACAAVGDAWVKRAPKALCIPLAIALGLFLLPPIPVPEAPLRGVAAMHLVTAGQVPSTLPEGVELIIWPEASIRGKHRLPEGPQPRGVHLATFTPTLGTHHLVGLTLKTPEGHLNAVASVDPDGNVLATRGKSLLVPVGERPFGGVPVLNGLGLIPGRAPPLLPVASTRVVAIICYEVFSRTLVMQGQLAGGELLAVLVSDRPLAGSRIAMEQSLGVVLLRAVEFQLPAVRASLGGISALVSPDGRILAASGPEHGERVLTSSVVPTGPGHRD
ncbi:nitrilase-related carbon-nitrogen hydrolase [Myxococcus faecalis]|uniref:nitrilase-related carbon-nitrogen hydrolase n=1 Tax=Myxococcus faecalis TaxID=3115646 RepID=UPI003CF8E2CC